MEDTQREKDIQALCARILEIGIESTGDHGPGGMCPFCGEECAWNAEMKDISHSSNCAYLIAKDLSTNH